MKVTVNSFRDRLRLRWTFEGHRYCVSLGISDTASNRIFAEQKAKEIELDLLSSHFDRTLLKYKPKILGKSSTELSCPELFKRYTQAATREKGLSPGSLRRYSCVQAHLDKRLNVPAHQVGERAAGDFAAQLSAGV